MRMRTAPGPPEPASEGHRRHAPLAFTAHPATTSRARGGASRSPLKVALQSHLGGTGIPLKTK